MSERPNANDAAARVEERDLVEALARFASLTLADERMEALAGLLGTVSGEHAALRALPFDLEPPAAFDPRWD